MKLDPAQITQLEQQGFLVLPDRYSEPEIAVIRKPMAALFDDGHPGNIIEKEAGVVRTSMGLHLRHPVFETLVRHPRLIEPAFQIRPEPMYVQQTKINVKTAFSGAVWQWHYDFATHHHEDGVERPQALNLHIFLDDVTHFNGPLYFIPGSHRHDMPRARLDVETTSYPLWIVDNETVGALARQHGIEAAVGRKGTVLIFFDHLIHGSPNNMSPWDRAIFSLILNPISNAYTHPTRPDFKHHRNLNPVVPLKDDCLFQYTTDG